MIIGMCGFSGGRKGIAGCRTKANRVPFTAVCATYAEHTPVWVPTPDRAGACSSPTVTLHVLGLARGRTRSSSSADGAGAAGRGTPRTAGCTKGTRRAHRAPTGSGTVDPLAIAGLRILVVPGHGRDGRPLLGVLRMPGEDRQRRPARDVVQLDAAAQHADERGRLLDRQVRVRATVGDDGDVLAGIEAEPGHHAAHGVEAVAREDAEVVAGLVGHRGRKRDLEVSY